VRWRLALFAALLMLIGLGWLLARLVWLYYYFGLFFFLVAGLLVGAISFRIARPVRPLETGRLIRGIVWVTLFSMVFTLDWEYRHFAATVGAQPRFPQARNAAVAAGREAREIRDAAERAFRAYLSENFPPGGPIGYARWSAGAGEVMLEVEGEKALITNDHRGIVWPVRTLGAALLLGAGLWFALESLRSTEPVTNLLKPGEEAMEEP
jgi:hypothetical protein